MKKEIIKLLHTAGEDGFVSGEEISQKLGVSRTAVWKHIKALKELGYTIKSQPKKGYKLERVPDFLLPEEIELNLDSSLFSKKIAYFKEVDSTNDEAKRFASLGYPEGTLVVAEKQVKGIWCSFVLRPDITPPEASKLTIIAAVSLVTVLQKQYGLEVKIKWPNDVMYNNKKLAGILTELSADVERVNYIVVGTGINVNTQDFPPEIEQLAISLKQITGKTYNRVMLLCSYLQQFEKDYQLFVDGNFQQIISKWKTYSETLGKRILVKGINQSFEGIALDIDADGRLIVKKEDGTEVRVNSGDVSLR
jgi:BirA family biotin operon repressor/biotin-[acetyl-CoA-carboxylase] ligase